MYFIAYGNDFGTDQRAWVPEIWAQETLAILERNMVMANLVHRDFENEVAEHGDVVNTRKPGQFEAERKGKNDDVTIQDATAEKVPVKLDQHIHTSFKIQDSEASKSFEDLVQVYLAPAALSIATQVDSIILGQVYQFLANQAGQLGKFSATSDQAKYDILAARKVLNDNLAPMADRNLILTSKAETEALKMELFTSAEKVGDEGTALREASLGRRLGFNIYMCQGAPSTINAAYTVGTDHVSSGAAGSTTVVLDGGSGSSYAIGQYITFDTVNDLAPYRITNIATDTLTINRPLRYTLDGSTDVNRYTMGAVDLAGHTGTTTYPAGYDKWIKVDGAGVPQTGQLVSFNDSSPNVNRAGEYCMIRVKTVGGGTYIMLDRPLDVALEDNDTVGYGPNGDYNFAFTKNALALVTRPLAPPKEGTGAISSTVDFNGLTIRVTITYDGRGQGQLVTLDLLCGVKVLDTDLGCVLLG